MKKKIIPIRNKCECGCKVTSHHFLCDKCWGERAKQKHKELVKSRLPKRGGIKGRRSIFA